MSSGAMDAEAPFPTLSLCLSIFLPIPMLLYWVFETYAHERRETNLGDQTESAEFEDVGEDEDESPREIQEVVQNTNTKVLFAALEHDVPGLDGARAKAGGLGKVVDLISRHHPGDIIMVHPMVKEDGKVKYGVHNTEKFVEEAPLNIMVDNVKQEVRVYRFRVYPAGEDNFKADFLLLSHKWFQMRTKETIYPNPMTRRGVLAFFSLWNQAVGELIARHKPHVYHCPDFHTAIAPWYAVEKHPDLKIVLTLHNAEYQGAISTDMIREEQLPVMAQIWNLPESIVSAHLVHQGRFNMLKAAVDFITERQDGRGVCAVSEQYARECYSVFSLFWNLPGIEGLPNPMLESERTKIDPAVGLHAMKAKAKAEIQGLCNLDVKPDARLFVSLGRLVRQKGVDLIADVTPWILRTFPNAQLIIAGPVADGFGCYAQEKLAGIATSPEFKGRVFIKCEFWSAPPSLKMATDFCVMPSRDEPFGYVDIEFAWAGAAMVGAKAGGLGKVPGFYYKAQNRDNLARLRRELCTVIGLAMNAPKEQLDAMADKGVKCSFPLAKWQSDTIALYDKVLMKDKLSQSFVSNRERVATAVAPAHSSFACVQSMLEVATTQQMSFKPMRTACEAEEIGEEFLVQELEEEELAIRVREKLKTSPDASIEDILKFIGADVNQERETDVVSKWLLVEHLGESRIHWLICFGFIASLASSTLTNVVAMYWGSRSSPFGEDKLFVVSALGQHIEIPCLWMPMICTTIEGFAFAVGAPIWATLSRYVEPRKLLAVNLLLKPSLLLVIAPFQPSAHFALVLIFMEGLIGSGMLLFVVYNFMMTIKADMSKVALRIGIMEMCRYGVTWGLSAYIFLTNPDKILETGENDRWRPFWVLAPIGVAVVLLTVVPGVLILSAPGPYRDDRFPGWNLGLIYKKRSFICLSISDMFGDFGKFASGMFLSWSLANHFSMQEMGRFCLVFVVCYMIFIGFWSFALSKASKHGASFLLGVVVLLAPPTILRGIVLNEVSNSYVSSGVGQTKGVLLICGVSLLLEGIRESSVWAAKIRILNSRWHLMSYGTVTTAISNFFRALSPWVCEYLLAQPQGASFITTNSKQLADAVVVCLIPISILQFIAQVSAMVWIREDIGITKKVTKANRTNDPWWWKNRFVFSYVAWFVIGTLMTLCFLKSYHEVVKPLDFYPAHNCHMERSQLPTTCKPRLFTGHEFKRNGYEQLTTARRKCYDLMRNDEEANTFVFGEGTCNLFYCDSIPNSARGKAESNGGDEVWSQHCSMSGQNLVLVQLFEWEWDDIAEECEKYLGPAGFDAVGVSPPVEHIKGDTWYLRYQPVSFKFESRGGTEAQFKNMVKRCTDNGVKVMSDVVLNHMAGSWIVNPRKYQGQQCGKTSAADAQCIGWNGTKFGDREFPHGRAGFDNFSRSHFHHYPFDDTSNCGCPPWLNNQVVCDFSGLPDLNTENNEVRIMLGKMLEKFHDMGVTMIRVDAARHIFPESLSAIIQKIPWDYVALEVYHDVKSSNPQTWNKLLKIGAAYDFAYSMMYTEMMADYVADKQDSQDPSDWKWECQVNEFERFLPLRWRIPECKAQICETPVPEYRTMLFVDNHDRQRDRFQEGRGGSSFARMCDWNIINELHSCLVNHKYGLQYHVLQSLLLTKDYGDAVRLMSSYAFFHYRQGPPGVAPDSLDTKPLRVYQNGKASGCRSKPQTSPASDDWELDMQHPWICEHRWEGVGGMVRFRKLVMKDKEANSMNTQWKDEEGGRIAFSLGKVGFVAISRGYNEWSKCGSKETKDLSNIKTNLPQGMYCNLARLPGDVPEPKNWKASKCTSDSIEIGDDKKIVNGSLPGGEIVVIHKDYRTDTRRDPKVAEAQPVLPANADKTFWGWRKPASEGDPGGASTKKGCCYAVSVLVDGTATGLRKIGELDAEACSETPIASPGSDREEVGWDWECPQTAEDAWEKIRWSRGQQQSESLKRVESYWIQTWVLFIFIVVAEASICVLVLRCKSNVVTRSPTLPHSESMGSVEMGTGLLENKS